MGFAPCGLCSLAFCNPFARTMRLKDLQTGGRCIANSICPPLHEMAETVPAEVIRLFLRLRAATVDTNETVEVPDTTCRRLLRELFITLRRRELIGQTNNQGCLLPHEEGYGSADSQERPVKTGTRG
jgi:hypothetical protein